MAPRRPLPPATLPEHPWERHRRQEFLRWERTLHRTPYGRQLPDVVGFAESVEPPLEWSERVERRRMFAVSALPTGPGPGYLVVVPPKHRPPPDGILVRLPQPTKQALAIGDGRSAVLVLEATSGWTVASWEEILPGQPLAGVGRIAPELAELLRLPVAAVETLLLPIVGSTPWHGRPAGLDLHLEVDGWPLTRYRTLCQNLARLAPSWVTQPRSGRPSRPGDRELASGARFRSRPFTRGRPFSILFRPISGPAAPSPTGDASRSLVTYGPALADEYRARIEAGTPVLLLEAEEARHVPDRPVEISDDVRTAVWGLHWHSPTPPDTPDWHRWFRTLDPDLRSAWDGRVTDASSVREGTSSSGLGRREFRDRLTQVACARARLRAASDVDDDDLRWVIDRMRESTARAIRWQARGRGPLARTSDRSEAGRTTRVRRALARVLEIRPAGVTVDDALGDLRAAGVTASPWDVETQLERLRIRGALYQDRTGRYRPV